jgi:hypothetical protein
VTTAAAERSASRFLNELAALRFDNVFNPYSDSCPEHDVVDAARIRRHNLERVLTAAILGGVDSMWVARDLGYRGGRRTGLALTDDIHLSWHAALLATPPLVRATKGPAVAERTATIVWRALRSISRPIFLWNVFPLHPHGPLDPMSNRCHSRVERTTCRPLLLWLLEALKPKRVVAIGGDAQAALADFGVRTVSVRHPSYGGQREFLAGIAEHYGVSPDGAHGQLPFRDDFIQCDLREARGNIWKPMRDPWKATH